MPKIKIIEKYEPTVNMPEEEISVYVPIKTTAAGIKVCRTADDVDDFKPTTETPGYLMALNLVKLGYTVVAEGLTDDPATSVTTRIDELKDRYSYDLRFLTSGDFNGTGGALSTMDKDIAVIAEKRGDCVALINMSYANNTEAKLSALPSGITEEVSEFVAAFYPSVTMSVKTTSGVADIEMPAVYAYLVSFMTSLRKGNPEWLAVAGSVRGVIPNFKSVDVELSQAKVDALQCRADVLDGTDDNKGCAVNPICNINPYGHLIWGNRTLKLNEGTLDAKSFLNVRNLISTIKKTVFMAANRYTFEQNDDILWMNFTSSITPVLDRMLSGSGIGGYKIVKQATNKKARLKALIQIVPIEAVEDFEVEIEIRDAEF
jgi:phage tail sheath protein FI